MCTDTEGLGRKIHGDQKFSVYLKITIQKVTSNVQSIPRQSPYIYRHAELSDRVQFEVHGTVHR